MALGVVADALSCMFDPGNLFCFLLFYWTLPCCMKILALIKDTLCPLIDSLQACEANPFKLC